MSNSLLNQWTNVQVVEDELIQPWMESFMIDRKIQNLSPGTIYFYKAKLKVFNKFCNKVNIIYIHQITPNVIREYLAYLESNGHNPGGIHCCYRALRTFLYWWENEVEPEGWKNPIKKVKAPKLAIEPLEPVSISDVGLLLNTCTENTLLCLRDKALMMFLLDSGARASEVCGINVSDLDNLAGSAIIRNGKGRKPRIVFLGQKTRRSMRAYLKVRNQCEVLQGQDALWVAKNGERLTYWGLNLMLERRAIKANVKKPELHGFRRAFALNYLRNGGDVYTLQKLMGHADMQVLKRYLAQTTEDLQIAHNKFSPVDCSRL